VESVKTGEIQSVEDALAKLENFYASAIDELLIEVKTTGSFTLGQTLRNRWIAHFLLIQFCRTPDFRDMMGSAMQAITAFWVDQHNAVKKAMAAQGQTVVPEPIIAPEMEMSALSHAKTMFGGAFATDIYPILFEHIWILGDNGTAQPFYTSDTPVVRHTDNAPDLHRGIGFNTFGVEIYLPLSSRFVLMLLERGWFTPILKKLNSREGDVWKLKPEEVDRFNAYQVSDSRREVYCRDGAFEVARTVVETMPEICDPDRPHFTVM
jgi:hypothetical protein